MGMSQEHRKERLDLTREAAAALVEDLQHMREILGRTDPSRAELRRLSVTLRRILVERDLSDVAAPRIGRIKLKAPDNKPIVKSNKKLPILYFGSGGVEVFGVHVRCTMLEQAAAARPLADFHPGRTVELRVDSFLSQPVLCLHGEWASRARVIEYMANIASGAHSGSPETATVNKRDAYRLLSRIRSVSSYSVNNGITTIAIDVSAATVDDPPFKYTPTAIDPVLLELLAAAHYLVISEDTAKLEQMIVEEIKAHT